MGTILAPQPDLLPATTRTINRTVALRLAAVVLVFALALFLRLRAVEYVEADYDEDDYLRAGQLYAQHIAAGDLAAIINERDNYEHPPLTKLVYGLILYGQGRDAYQNPVTAYANDKPPDKIVFEKVKPLRSFGAITGALTAALVAGVNPLAGVLVAVNSWHIKYTNEAMLEALPCLFAALTLLLLRRSKRTADNWWWAAAISMGITASGKYLYAVGAVAVLIWLLMRNRREWKMALVWGAVSVLVFFIFDPALWADPVGRLYSSLTFNTSYATGSHVQETGFGWFQPVAWLFGAVPWLPDKHPEVFPFLLDGLFAFFGVLALKRTWRSDRLVALWFAVSMIFLFFWPTKWPQYILTVTVPVSLMSARWLTDSGKTIWANWRNWRSASRRVKLNWREALLWLLPTLLLFALIVVYPLVLQTALATTNFQVKNLRDGTGGLMNAFGTGLTGIPPATPGKLPYIGTGAAVFILGWDGFYNVLRFNILWVVVSMVLATALGMWLAALLQRRGVRGKLFWRTIFILPWAIPEFVGALIWSTLFDDTYGGLTAGIRSESTRYDLQWLSQTKPLFDLHPLFNPLVELFRNLKLEPLAGLTQYVADGLSPVPAFWIMVLVGVWVAFPFMMLVSGVALRSISAEVYDAARVDGAKGWRMWSGITWPLISATIYAGVLLRGVMLFNAFHIPMMLIADVQGTGTATLSLYSYGVLRYGNGYSTSALLNMATLFIVVGLVSLYNRQTRVVEGLNYV